MKPLKVVILAAGQGTRMKSKLPKVCHPIGGLSMLGHVVSTAQILEPEEIVVVISPETPTLEDEINTLKQHFQAPLKIAIQATPLGTGHAVLAAQSSFQDFDGDVLVLFGDTPLISSQTLQEMRDSQQAHNSSIVVLGMTPDNPNQYARIQQDENGFVARIIECADATEDELENPLCNSGVMLLDGKDALTLLSKIDNKNAKDEYYLTDVVSLAVQDKKTVSLVNGHEEELLGANSRVDLAQLEYIFQTRMRTQALEGGVTLLDPETVYFAYDTEIESDVVISQNVTFGPGVTIASDVLIKPFCHLEGATIREGAQIGPFAHLRPGSKIGKQVKVGNFVEIKKSVLDEGAKVNHLSYIGDAEVGKSTNIGAGTITCNYDGFKKNKTVIGDHAFIGSNSALVAPVEVGDRAIIGAGSVITRKVLPDAMGYSRAPQQEILGGATRYRRKRSSFKVINKKG